MVDLGQFGRIWAHLGPRPAGTSVSCQILPYLAVFSADDQMLCRRHAVYAPWHRLQREVGAAHLDWIWTDAAAALDQAVSCFQQPLRL